MMRTDCSCSVQRCLSIGGEAVSPWSEPMLIGNLGTPRGPYHQDINVRNGTESELIPGVSLVYTLFSQREKY